MFSEHYLSAGLVNVAISQLTSHPVVLHTSKMELVCMRSSFTGAYPNKVRLIVKHKYMGLCFFPL